MINICKKTHDGQKEDEIKFIELSWEGKGKERKSGIGDVGYWVMMINDQ
jgi:hypothetical protein